RPMNSDVSVTAWRVARTTPTTGGPAGACASAGSDQARAASSTKWRRDGIGDPSLTEGRLNREARATGSTDGCRSPHHRDRIKAMPGAGGSGSDLLPAHHPGHRVRLADRQGNDGERRVAGGAGGELAAVGDEQVLDV